MASIKSFKPPVKHNPSKAKLPKKPAVSLTDEQYEELFYAVIHPSQQVLKSKSPTAADSPRNEAKSPTESAAAAKQTINLDGTSSISTLNSEEFINNAVFSTPNIIKKSKTNLNNSKKATKINKSVSENFIADGPLSQPPRHLSKRERLQWLQERRGTGMYVKCDNVKCGKWRWLDNPDPVDLPPKWFCYMNPDKSIAACSATEATIPTDVENDLVHNCYTTGSIVWAKMAGYPWWPAMVDDCPDCEQYYWCNNFKHIIPDYYNVVFFDNTEVTRHWILVKNLKSFKHYPDFDKKFELKQIYKKRLLAAKETATAAVKMHIRDRLKQYSFVALWDKEIPEFLSSSDNDSDVDESIFDYERRIKKKIIERKKAHSNKYKVRTYKNKTINSATDRNALTENNPSIIITHKENEKTKVPIKKLKRETLLSTKDREKNKHIKEIKKLKETCTIKEVKKLKESSTIKVVKKLKESSIIKEVKKLNESTTIKGVKKQNESSTIKGIKKQNESSIIKGVEKQNESSIIKEVKKQNGSTCTKTIDETSKCSNLANIQKDIPIEDKQSLSQEKDKDKENITINSGQPFRPIDQLLDENRPDRDLAQKAYDLCFNLFTSGKHGELQFEKMYKKITMNNNIEKLTLEEPNKSFTKTCSPAIKETQDSTVKKNQGETSAPKRPKTPQVLPHSKNQKRKIETISSNGDKIIKKAKKSLLDNINNTNPTTSDYTVSSVSNVPENIFQESEHEEESSHSQSESKYSARN